MNCVVGEQLDLGVEGVESSRPVPKLNRRSTHTFRFKRPDEANQEVLWVPSVPELRLPKEHFVRRLLAMTEEVLGPELRSRRVLWGGFSYDPVAVFSILMYALMLGERSLRRIEELCLYDTRFHYLSGGTQPDHTAFHRFRHALDADNGLDRLMLLVVERAKQDGLVKGRSVVVDGTKIPTNGSQWRKFINETDDAEPPPPEALGAIEPPVSAPEPPATDSEPKKTKPKKKFKAPSDKEARTMKTTHGEFVNGYNCQIAVDAQNGIVVGAMPTDVPNDWSAVGALLKTTQKHSGVVPKRVVGDKGYESSQNMQAAEGAGVKSYFCPKSRKDQPFKPDADGVLRCLAGHVPSQGATTKRGVAYTVYKVSQCRTCALREICGQNPKSHQREMNIQGDEHMALSQANRARCESEAGKKLLKKRGQTVELPFARIKRDYRMRRFNLKGLAGARLELLFACVTLNVQTVLRSAGDGLERIVSLIEAIYCIWNASLTKYQQMHPNSA
jgi:transposase